MSTMQVQDGRGTLAGWALTALTSGDLVTGGPTVRTIALGTSAAGGPLTLTTGTITPVGISSLLNVSAGAGGSLNPSQPVTVATAAFGFGGGTYSFTPTVRLTPPANTYSGSYTTTVTFTLTG
jgi:phage tail tape-measure protein